MEHRWKVDIHFRTLFRIKVASSIRHGHYVQNQDTSVLARSGLACDCEDQTAFPKLTDINLETYM